MKTKKMDNTKWPIGKKIILFDADCMLCNQVVTFISERDKKDVFRFCGLQSVTGKEIINQLQIAATANTVVLYDAGVAYYIKSEAVLEIAKDLSGFVQCLIIFRILPLWLRDKIYDFIAKNRHKWQNNKTSCDATLGKKLL